MKVTSRIDEKSFTQQLLTKGYFTFSCQGTYKLQNKQLDSQLHENGFVILRLPDHTIISFTRSSLRIVSRMRNKLLARNHIGSAFSYQETRTFNVIIEVAIWTWNDEAIN